MVFRSLWASGSLEIIASHRQSFRVVDSLSWSLTVFQSLHLNCYFWCQTYSLPIFGGLSGSLAVPKGILCCFHMTQMKRQGLLEVFSWSFMVAEIDFESIPVTLSLSLRVVTGFCNKFHSCFHIVVHGFWRNFKFSKDRETPLMTVWKPGFRLEWSGCDKRKHIKNFFKGQSLFDVHRQYL